MKKVTGIVLSMILAGIVLSGCYTKTCDNPPAPMSYKGEAK